MKGFFINDEFLEFGVLSYFFFNFFIFGIGEEIGWWGYVLLVL